MRMNWSVAFILFFILFTSLFSRSQLITDTAQTPVELVLYSLIDNNVSIFNVEYTGSSQAIGSFTAMNTNLGIEEGIVLTTGTVVSSENGPQGPNNAGGSGMDNGSEGSELLSNEVLDGLPTFNAAILEFDFISNTGKILLNYVFGSEEYPEFAPPNSSSFNDAFGFFITGPGIDGYYNMATIPGIDVPVSINNVNLISNSEYFVENGDGNTSPYNGSEEYIQYDGFTTKLKAEAMIEAGEIYHLTIAIADAGDASWDSGVFMEKNSLSASITDLENNNSKKLVQILDPIGRKTVFKPNTFLIYVYDDGSTDRIFSIEY